VQEPVCLGQDLSSLPNNILLPIIRRQSRQVRHALMDYDPTKPLVFPDTLNVQASPRGVIAENPRNDLWTGRVGQITRQRANFAFGYE
jgi:hypothetical protein